MSLFPSSVLKHWEKPTTFSSKPPKRWRFAASSKSPQRPALEPNASSTRCVKTYHERRAQSRGQLFKPLWKRAKPSPRFMKTPPKPSSISTPTSAKPKPPSRKRQPGKRTPPPEQQKLHPPQSSKKRSAASNHSARASKNLSNGPKNKPKKPSCLAKNS